MTRISLGLVTLLALSSAVSMVNAHDDKEQHKFNIPGDAEYDASKPELETFKVSHPSLFFSLFSLLACLFWSKRQTHACVDRP